MKKIAILIVMLSIVTAAAFAQSYTVQSVTGRVQREAGNVRVEVKTGETLAAETVIYTGVGASLVLKSGDKTFTVPAARSGKVTDLASASSGLRISGSVARTDTDAAARTTAQVSTASARASDAAAEEDLVAE